MQWHLGTQRHPSTEGHTRTLTVWERCRTLEIWASYFPIFFQWLQLFGHLSATGESGIGVFEQFSFDFATVFSCFSNKHWFIEGTFGSSGCLGEYLLQSGPWDKGNKLLTLGKRQKRGTTVPDLGHFVTGAEGVTKSLTEGSDMQEDVWGPTRDDKIRDLAVISHRPLPSVTTKVSAVLAWADGDSH